MAQSVIDILGSPTKFLDNIFNQLEGRSVDVSSFYLDHICYRVDSKSDYELIRFQLLQIGELLSDKMIGGRPISVIEMDESIDYKGRFIDMIELPSPKQGRPYAKGYEHVEFVVEGSLETFLEQYPDIEFDRKGMAKSVNRDLRLELNGVAVKFHEESLKYVIEFLD